MSAARKSRAAVNRDAEFPQLDVAQFAKLWHSAVQTVDAPTWAVLVRESQRRWNADTQTWESVERPCVLEVRVDVPALVKVLRLRAMHAKTRRTTTQSGAVVVRMVWQGERPASWPARKSQREE